MNSHRNIYYYDYNIITSQTISQYKIYQMQINLNKLTTM